MKIYLDFDGIVTSDMSVDRNGNVEKTLSNSAKSVLKQMSTYADVYIVSGSQTEESQRVTQNIVDKLDVRDLFFVKPHSKAKFISDSVEFGEYVVYAGDDIYDSAFSNMIDIEFYSTNRNLVDAEHLLSSRYSLYDLHKKLKPHHEPLLARMQSVDSISIVQMYSSRSNETGEYDVMTDGNLAFMIDTLMQIPSCIDVKITYPENSNFDEYEDFFRRILPNVIWYPARYGMNAAETREIGVIMPDEFATCEMLVSYFVQDASIAHEFDASVLIANVSPVFNINRPHLDEFYEFGVTKFELSAFDQIYVFNHNQIEYFENLDIETVSEVDILYYGDFSRAKFEYLSDYKTIKDVVNLSKQFKTNKFFPFRLTDPDYKLDKIDEKVFIIDTNDSYASLDESTKEFLIPIKDFVSKQFHSKIYYSILKSQAFEIPVYADCSKIAHIGLFELFETGNIIDRSPEESVRFIAQRSAI